MITKTLFALLMIICAVLLSACARNTGARYVMVCSNCQRTLDEYGVQLVSKGAGRAREAERIAVACRGHTVCNQGIECVHCDYGECKGGVPARSATLNPFALEEVPLQPVKSSEPVNAVADISGPTDTAGSGELIRVGVLGEPADRPVSIVADGPFSIVDGKTEIGRGTSGVAATVNYAGGRFRLTEPVSQPVTHFVRLDPVGSTVFEVINKEGYNRFRGAIEVRYSAASRKVWVVNELDLETYLKGIGEEPEQMSGIGRTEYQEFLKVSAIVFRSYALSLKSNGKRNRTEPFDILATASDQVYLGYGRELHGNNLADAVEETSGQVVTYNGSVAKTPYFGSCDGSTRAGGSPWLVPVASPFCAGREMAGHGWGMCMHGARTLAGQGRTYDSIIEYYFPLNRLEKR
ncbi:MAG: SpoIID/LytB domain-containing protein [Terriglobia bacterium]